jgi:hypothetical protein
MNSRRRIFDHLRSRVRTALHQNRKDCENEGLCDNVRCGNPEQFMSPQVTS